MARRPQTPPSTGERPDAESKRRDTDKLTSGLVSADEVTTVQPAVDEDAEGDGKRRPTDKFASGLVAADEVTTTTPSYSEEVTTTTPAVGDDVFETQDKAADDLLGSGRLEAGHSEPSKPNAIIGGPSRRRIPTSPYQRDASGELRLAEQAKAAEEAAQEEKKKKKKSLPRRILKGLLWTVAIVLLLVLLVIGFFHTGPGKSVAKDIAEGALNKRYDGKVTIGELDYAIFGDVEIKDLVIAEHSGKEVVHLKSLLLDLDWGSLLSKPMTIERLAIAGLDLDLVTFPDGTSNLRRMQKEPTKLPEQIVVQALDVSGVNVQIERPDGQKVSVSDLGLAASLALDNPAQKLDLALTDLHGKLETPQAVATFVLAADAKRDGRSVEAKLTPKNLEVTSKTFDKTVTVAMEPIAVTIEDDVAEMSFGGLAAGPISIAGMRTLGRLPPPGQLGLGPGEHLLELNGVRIDHQALAAFTGQQNLLTDIRVDASVKGPTERLVVDGKVDTDGGDLALSGTVDARDLLAPVIHLVLEGQDIDTTKILAGEKRPDLQTDFKATVDLVGLPPNHTLTFHADVDETTVRGNTIDSVVIDASGKGQLIQLDGLEVSAFGQVVKLDGEFDQGTREFRAHVGMNTLLGEAIQRARDAGVLIAPLPPLDGKLDVDLGVTGKLKPKAEPPPGVEPQPATPFDPNALIVNGRIDLSSLPIETLAVKGKVGARDVAVKGLPGNARGIAVGLVDADIDLDVEGAKPDGIRGGLVARVEKLDTGKQSIDLAEVTARFDGLKQDITIKVDDERQGLALDVALKSLLDLERRHVDTTIERLYAKRGNAETRLTKPTTLQIDMTPDGKQKIDVPPVQLEVAGGTVDVAVKAQLSKDEANPGANKVDRFDVNVDLDGVDIGRLAALARRSTRGLSGRLDGSLRAQGTKDNPQVDFFANLRGRVRRGTPFTAKIEGALRDKKLDLAVRVQDRGARDPLVTLDVLAPLNLPTTPGAKPSLGAGRFSVRASLPTTEVSRLAALLSRELPETVDPNATLGFDLDLAGTTNRPTGRWSLDFEGDLLRRRGYDQAPARQKIAVAGSLDPDGREVVLENGFDLHFDAAGPAYLAHRTSGRFSRSPLLRGFMERPWSLVAGLDRPIDLAALHQLGLAKRPLSGTMTTKAELNGQGQDLLGTIALDLADVRAGTAPPADVAGLITIGPDDIRIQEQVTAAGLEAVVLDLVVGVPGRGLRRAARNRGRLMEAPLSGSLRLVPHAISEWKQALGELGAKVPDLPGQVAGELTFGGDLKTPTARGAFAWDGFETAHGAPGRVAFEIEADEDRAGGGLALGAEREVTILASVSRADLEPPKTRGEEAPPPLPIAVAMKAQEVDLLRLVPAFATAGKPLKIKGVLDWDMGGTVLRSRDPAQPGLMPGSQIVGDLVVSSLDIEVPDTDRHIERGRIAIATTPEAIEIRGIELYEGRYPDLPGFAPPSDEARGDRTVNISGRVPWTDLKISEAGLRIQTHDWLVLGLGFDGPEGELDLDVRVTAKDLMQPVKRIDVSIDSLDLYAPNRYIRAHYPQFPAYDDVIYLDESRLPAGVLPPPKGTPAPVDPNAPPPPPPDPTKGFDVHLAIPHGIHVIFAGTSNLELELQGAMDVTMRGKDLGLKGRIDVTKGVLGAMGRDFDLVRGAIVADGGIESAQVEMLFAVEPHEIALRDAASGAHGDVSTITVQASAKTGLTSKFGGVSGPYLLDMATFLNTGRARLWGLPDVPASETVRFGNPDQGLVLTFIQTNLTNLIFMDRMNGWSESLEEPAEYGRLRFFDMQRFIGGSRVRFIAQPVEIGQNRMELRYDWLLANSPNTVFGFGPHLGTDLRAGVGFTLDWSTAD